MKLAIARKGNNIITLKNYTDVKDSIEVARFLIEIEIMKEELLELWKKMSKNKVR